MSVPGQNILLIALGAIARTPVAYYKDLGRTTSATGRDVTQFADVVIIEDSQVQAVPRNRYENMGLDYQKDYVTWFVANNVIDLKCDVSGDQMTWNGKRYQLVSETDWFAMDGWTYVLCVQIGTA